MITLTDYVLLSLSFFLQISSLRSTEHEELAERSRLHLPQECSENGASIADHANP
jgi:hypothetical protein